MLKIYGVPLSVHTRKVIVVALTKGLEYENLPVVPVVPGNPPPNWRELSPTGKIPAITDGDFTLADSAAICVYLDRQYPRVPVYPRDTRPFAEALALEQFAGNLFREVVHPLFHESIVHPRIRNVPTDQKRIDDVLARAVPENFGYLDGELRGDWLAGDGPTVADFAVTSNLITYRYLGFDLYADRYPRLAAHFERTLRQPAVREALRREQAAVDSMQLDRSWHVQDR
jgi:glutathione S-transferase